MEFNFYMPTKLLFGKGKLNELHAQKLPGKKALIVTSAGQSVKKFGYLARVEEQLDKAGAEHVLFDKILPNPISEHVMEGASAAKNAQCDFVVGLGGGSSIDSAKAIAIMATNPGHYWDYIGAGSGKGLAMPNKPLPVVAITTTAGTGTEADPWMVITHGNEKIGFGGDGTFPMLSVIDPELMATVPAKLTAYQGFDALFHSTEGYINNTHSFMSDMLALQAIALIGRSLARAVANPDDQDARAEVALANTLSGIVESTSGCTSEHSLEHAMSGEHPSLEHGAGLVMVSKAYYGYFAGVHACDSRLITMAQALGMDYASKPEDFITALTKLQKACGVDGLKMSDYGIERDEMEKLAKHARDTMGKLFLVDPQPIPQDEVVKILQKSFK